MLFPIRVKANDVHVKRAVRQLLFSQPDMLFNDTDVGIFDQVTRHLPGIVVYQK
jgi:hypothetical protein